jgi:diguanylate cyclase (GGDEF)-like protein
MDLDHFKQINDALGHAEGDRVLRAVARAISSSLRSYDLAARYAGDEFAVVLPDTDRSQAVQAAERIRRSLFEASPELQRAIEVAPDFGISIGIATFPEDAADCEGLIGCSDRAMYEEKRRRKAA